MSNNRDQDRTSELKTQLLARCSFVSGVDYGQRHPQAPCEALCVTPS